MVIMIMKNMALSETVQNYVYHYAQSSVQLQFKYFLVQVFLHFKMSYFITMPTG